MELILIALAVAVRLLLINTGTGFESDVNCFKAWSIMLFEGGFSDFYLSDAFTDYPPGYMYALYVVGFFRDALGLDYDSETFTWLIKLPALICDVVSVAFIYTVANKHMPKSGSNWLSKNGAFIISLCYALNPAIIINSAIWGQVDAVYTLPLIISIYYVAKGGLLPGYLLYAVVLLIKPQGLMFAPVYLFSAYSALKNRFNLKSLFKYCVASAGVILLGILPFAKNLDFTPVIGQYVNTILSYPYASVNAYNFYSLFGGNWAPVSEKLLFLPYSTYSLISIVIITIVSIVLLYKDSSPANYFFTAALISISTFTFVTRMHERYIFPAVILLTLTYILGKSNILLLFIAGFSLTLYMNCADVLKMYATGEYSNNITPISLINVGLCLFMLYSAFRTPKSRVCERGTEKFTRIDAISLAAITVCYAAVAFTNLGETSAPETEWAPEDGDEIVADLGEGARVTHVFYHNGVTVDELFLLAFSNDGILWKEELLYSTGGVFTWQEQPAEFTARYVRIKSLSKSLRLRELGFKNKGVLLPVKSQASELFDEQELVPELISYRNSAYFDEIYHARTAYEYLNRLPAYETTHPPLGKVIISWGISLFGMNPFGFRVMGTSFGVLMLPIIYMFAKKLCGGTFWPSFAALIMAVDFMHFSQTRIATIDVFVTFFVLAMFYFMYIYSAMDFDEPLHRLFIPLFFSGLFMGLAVASKWQGVYAGIGLGAVFFADLYSRRKSPGFKERAWQVIGGCFIFFVGIPALVYVLSYIPYMQGPGMDGLRSVYENQLSMFSYHSELEATHPFESPWWHWPLDIRPIFYYIGHVGGLREGISSMGNPLCWYAGLVAVVYSLWKKHDSITLFLGIAIASQMLPWALVTRCTFIYHYFPSVAFVFLMLTRALADNSEKKTAMAIVAAAFVLFVFYYPVLSGMAIDPEFVHKYLEWLPTWNII